MKTPADVLKITIVYDNNPFDPRLKTAWGFSALVEYQGQTLLFDTGGLGALLDGNDNLPVYLLPSFADAYKRQVGQLTQVIEVTPGQVLGDSILTTGEISGNIPEQALVIQTEDGLVVITGCAHPGIVRIIESAMALTNDPVYLALGGFHLGSTSETEISAILADFRRLGVKKVAPCHCSGERAIAMFATEYGQEFVQAGVGTVITLDGGGIDHEYPDN